MPPFLQFVIRRFLLIPISLIIERYHLRDPFLVVAVAAPYLSPQDLQNPGMYLPVGRAMDARPFPPVEKANLGMFPFGFDVYHSLVWGTRDALQFGLIVTISTAVFGILYGAIAGMAGTRTSTLMLRIADAFLAFPPIAGFVLLHQLFAITFTAMGGMYFSDQYYGQIIEITDLMTTIQFLLEKVNPLMLSLIVFSWMPYARLVNSIVITLKQTDFIQAARALGAIPFWIVRKHLLQNATGPAMVLAARDVGGGRPSTGNTHFYWYRRWFSLGYHARARTRLGHWCRWHAAYLLVGVPAADHCRDGIRNFLEYRGRWAK